MKLPPFRKAVKIRFSSLRNAVGPNLGVIFDVDTMVEREAYRKKTDDGWKWQIKGFNRLPAWDTLAETDQEILDEYGKDLDVEII